MITVTDLGRLIDQWKLMLAHPAEDYYDIAYKDGINTCIYDLTNLIDDLTQAEERAYTYMNEIGGD